MNKRGSKRMPVFSKLSVTHENIGTVIGKTQNLSDTGVFVHSPDLVALEPGDLVEIQLQGLPEPAPLLIAKVVRKNSEGVGLMFIHEQ